MVNSVNIAASLSTRANSRNKDAMHMIQPSTNAEPGATLPDGIGRSAVRRICPSCAEPYELSQNELEWYQRLGGSSTKKVFMKGTGCQFCSNTGYRERVGVYEVLAVTEDVSHALVAGATPHEVRKIAVDLGMRTMGFEGMQLVERDITTIDEVVRNVHVH